MLSISTTEVSAVTTLLSVLFTAIVMPIVTLAFTRPKTKADVNTQIVNAASGIVKMLQDEMARVNDLLVEQQGEIERLHEEIRYMKGLLEEAGIEYRGIYYGS